MNTTNDAVAITSAERCVIDDDNDELYNASLSDEEILSFFLKEGCDLDGTPLILASQDELHHGAPHRPVVTLH